MVHGGGEEKADGITGGNKNRQHGKMGGEGQDEYRKKEYGVLSPARSV